MRLAITNLVLVIGCVASSWGQNQVGYGYLPPQNPLVPGPAGTPNTFIRPTTSPTRPPTRPPQRPPQRPPARPQTTRPPSRPPSPPPRPPTPSRRPPPPPPPPSRPPPPPPSRPPRPPPSRPPPSRPPPSRPPPSRPPPEDHHHHHHSDDPLQWLRDSVPGEPGDDYPIFGVVPPTAFSCESRVPGYYADTETRCQAFHVCSAGAFGGVSQISFLCPNGTIFNQEHFTCEWWNQVQCEQTESYYELNNQIGVVPEGQSRPRPQPQAPAPAPPRPRPQPSLTGGGSNQVTSQVGFNQPRPTQPRPTQPRPPQPRPPQPRPPQPRPPQSNPTTFRPQQGSNNNGYDYNRPSSGTPGSLYDTPGFGNRF